MLGLEHVPRYLLWRAKDVCVWLPIVAGNLEVSVVGDFEPAELEDCLLRYVGTVERRCGTSGWMGQESSGASGESSSIGYTSQHLAAC